MVLSQKVTLIGIWNTEGFHVVDVLPKGAMLDINCYCEDILSEILRVCPVRSNRRLVVHADNARPIKCGTQSC
jgi:hypothetical protein